MGSSGTVTRAQAWPMFIEKTGNVDSLQSLFVTASGTVAGYGKRPLSRNGYRPTILLRNVRVSLLPDVVIDHVWIDNTNALGAALLGTTIYFMGKIKEYAPPKFTFRDLEKLKRIHFHARSASHTK